MNVVSKICVVAAVLDTQNLKLYKEDGSTILIPQGDTRIRSILDQATPQIMQHGKAYLDLTSANENHFAEFEKQSSVVRLFKVAKSKLASLFGGPKTEEPLQPVQIGSIPDPVMGEADKMQAAVNEILLHAVPVTAPEFTQANVLAQRPVQENGSTPAVDNENQEEAATHTIVAVVDNKTVVPGAEKIESQFARAAAKGNTVGMDNFMRRISAVIAKRKHSVQDLLRFLERGDLPIADDGSIIIYKVLRQSNGKYVDCHTRKVPQQVGSYVCMDESLVDPNRRNECSNGLHVARRGYVSGFSGDVCVMAKLAPEDVIAVPEYDANKMRVCGYHIIFELPKDLYDLLKANKPITNTEHGKALLAKALAGDHIGITEEVRITKHAGEGVVITPKTGKPEQPPAVPDKPLAPPAKEEALPDSLEQIKAPPVDPKAVVKEVAALSRKDQAKSLYEVFIYAKGTVDEQAALQELVTFKKQAKVGWEKLGIPNPVPQPEAKKADKPVAKPKVKAQAKPKAVQKTQPVKASKTMMTPREEIQHLLPKFNAATGKEKAEFAKDILKLKQQAKKSWDVLGVSKAESEAILLRTK